MHTLNHRKFNVFVVSNACNILAISKLSHRVGMRNISDYSPFGVLLPERTSSTAFYRRGFQDQEHDDEVKGDGNSVNFKYRMHDPRVGRFFAVDPLAPKYPHNSPYAFSENDVIAYVELEGLEKGSARYRANPTTPRIGRVTVGNKTQSTITPSQFTTSRGFVYKENTVNLRDNFMEHYGQAFDHVMNDMEHMVYKPRVPVPKFKGNIDVISFKYNSNAASLVNSSTIVFSNIEDEKAFQKLEDDYNSFIYETKQKMFFEMGYGDPMKQGIMWADKGIKDVPEKVQEGVSVVVKILAGPSPKERLISSAKTHGKTESMQITIPQIDNKD